MEFASCIKGVTSTGKIAVNKDGVMTIKDAGEVVLSISAAINYGGKNADETCHRIFKGSAYEAGSDFI